MDVSPKRTVEQPVDVKTNNSERFLYTAKMYRKWYKPNTQKASTIQNRGKKKPERTNYPAQNKYGDGLNGLKIVMRLPHIGWH